MIVVDSSAMVNLLLNASPHAEAIAARLRDNAGAIAVPHLLDVEVGQVLRRVVLRAEMSEDGVRRALDRLLSFPLRRFGHELLLARALEMRDNVTVYDGVFLALAEALKAPLLTSDARLSRSSGHRAEVVLV